MIPIFKPCMGDEEINAVGEVLKSGWLGLGPKTEEFEKKFANYIGTKHAVALNSCTAALHLAGAVLDIRGGEVITTPITFVSTAHSIIYNESKPVFADVQPDTVNLDPVDIKRKISPKTKAIIPVHYGGHPCEMDEIIEIADNHNLNIIEDAAHACGSEYKNRKAGSLGIIGCFSFHAVKNLATGDGGMITTNDTDLYEKLTKLRWLGINKSTFQRDKSRYSWDYDVEYLGFKMHMNDINAAIGLVQLQKLDMMNKKRRVITRRYNEEFSHIDAIEIPSERNYVKSSLHNYAIKLKKGDRNKFIQYLSEKGVSVGVHYRPLYLHSIYKKMGIGGICPVSDKVWEKLVILPLFPDMIESEIEQVIDAVKTFDYQ